MYVTINDPKYPNQANNKNKTRGITKLDLKTYY